MRKFDLSTYVEAMAWKAFLRSKDPAVDIDDFIQEARIAVWKAASGYDPEKSASLNTYTVNGVFMAMRRLLSKQKKLKPVEPLCENTIVSDCCSDDDLWIQVTDVLERATPPARKVLLGAVRLSSRMKNCSRHSLRKILCMTAKDFNDACNELAEI